MTWFGDDDTIFERIDSQRTLTWIVRGRAGIVADIFVAEEFYLACTDLKISIQYVRVPPSTTLARFQFQIQDL